ncbi:MAG: PadR family transcriptional regulator [Fimbriimonas ginsengisoli]|nr:PadR family transcriptional regulator [Fimbriimonas ginsengisoli]
MVGDSVSSGYAMRKEMNRMRGGRWSSESGSVYRVLRRLEEDHLVLEARRVGVPNRERTEYELTAEGERLLSSWLMFPPDRSELALLIDPIRSRAYFLPRLKPPDQIRVVKGWLQESKLFIEDLEQGYSSGRDERDPIRRLACQNLLYLAEARHEWLRRMLSELRSRAALALIEDAPARVPTPERVPAAVAD